MMMCVCEKTENENVRYFWNSDARNREIATAERGLWFALLKN